MTIRFLQVSLDSTYSITTTRYGSYDFDAPSHSQVTVTTHYGLAKVGQQGGAGGRGGQLPPPQSLFELKMARRRRDGSIDSGWSSSEQRAGTPVLSGFTLRRDASGDKVGSRRGRGRAALTSPAVFCLLLQCFPRGRSLAAFGGIQLL